MWTLAGALCAVLLTNSAMAADRATKEEAVAMVQKAVAFIKSNGPDKAYPAITDRKGQFVDRDLYIVVYSLDGKVLAHGGNAKLVGQDLAESQDVDGVYYVRDRMELAKKNANFWQDYKFADPTTKKIEPKTTYCEVLDKTAVCGGIYKVP
jgi:signal transduction histidine kinase